MTDMLEFTFENIWETYYPAIAHAANTAAKKYAEFGAEAGDFRQEAAAWLMQEKTLEKLAHKFEHVCDSDQERFDHYLMRCINNEFIDYGIDIREQAGGQDRQTAFWYTKDQLKALLEQVFDDEAWLDPPVMDGEKPRGKSDPAHGGNHITTLADVSRALDALPEQHRDLIVWRHQCGWTHKQIGEALEIGESAASNRYDRAIHRLQEELGGDRPDPMRPAKRGDPWRGRHAVSNRTARAYQGSLYDGAAGS